MKHTYFHEVMSVEIDDALRRQIREQLEQMRAAGIAVSDLADKLDVKRATVYQLLLGETTPTAKVLCNACRNLNMFFQLNGHRIAAVDFQPAHTLSEIPIQLGLFEIRAITSGDQLSLKMSNKRSPGLEVDVELRVG